MNPRQLSFATSLSGILVVSLCGCTIEDVEETYAVAGQVSLDGKPLTSDLFQATPEVTLQFRSDNRTSAATLEADGTYQALLAAGTHRVALNINYARDPSKSGIEQFKSLPPKSPIPSRYLYFDSSRLSIVVKPGMENRQDIEFKSRR